MEIQLISPDSIKIKGKNASVVFDPISKVEAEIVIATKAIDTLDLDKVSNMRLMIAGPGDYEAGGISVTGKMVKDKVVYTILENMKIVFADSSVVGELADDEGFDAVIVHVTDSFSDESLGSISTKAVFLYGDLAKATVKSENQETTNKVNLKKASDETNKTYLLS